MVLNIFLVVIRIVGIFVCVDKAQKLNRSQGGWGFFGFVSPIVAMIWIHCLKPNIDWSIEESKQN